METLKFKTNIKCGGCVATVTPFLNDQKEISSWSVDTNTPDKLLTVEGKVTEEVVIEALEKAGYKGERV
jgi:copper chaperone